MIQLDVFQTFHIYIYVCVLCFLFICTIAGTNICFPKAWRFFSVKLQPSPFGGVISPVK